MFTWRIQNSKSIFRCDNLFYLNEILTRHSCFQSYTVHVCEYYRADLDIMTTFYTFAFHEALLNG